MRCARALLEDRRGLIALKFALALPGLALLAVGAIDLRAVASDRAAFQSVAEAAALAGARELALAVDESGPMRRAESWGQAQLSQMTQHPKAEVVASVEALPTGQRALKVAVDGRRPSFFGNLLPPGGWRIHADATAASVATLPLCILAHDTKGGVSTFRLRSGSRIDAPACLLHTNASAQADSLAKLDAAATQAVGRASGPIAPAPHNGAPPIDDPYVDIDFGPPSGCPKKPPKTQIKLDTTLQPGVHCGNIEVLGSAQLTLAPGDHWFVDGVLSLEKTSRLVGSDVTMIFQRAAFDFAGQSRVALSGREDGPFAGFVIVGLRPPGGSWCGVKGESGDDEGGGLVGGLVGGLLGILGGLTNPILKLVDPDSCAKARGSVFVMSSDNVDQLEGVIYTPVSMFVVYGTSRVTEAADWTVMIVRRLQIVGSPTLVINANYGASPVPVPEGVGDKVGELRLID